MGPSPFAPDDPEADRDLREALRDASPETLRAFVILAVLVQAGLFVGSLAVMLAAFRGRWVVGGALVALGVVLLGLAVVLYRTRERSV